MPHPANAPKRLAPLRFASMRGRFAPVLATALGAVALAPTAPSAAATSSVQTFAIKLSTTKAGTSAKPAATGLTFETSQKTTPGFAVVPLLSVAIDFPKEIRINPDRFRSCMQTGSPCTGKLSSPGVLANGKAHLAVGAVQPKFDTGALVDADRQFFVWAQHAEDDSLPGTKYLFPAKLSKPGGHLRFAYEVSVDALKPLDGQPGEFTDFTLGFPKKTATVKGKKYGLVELAGCPKGGYVFKGEFKYVDGSTASLTSTVPCTKA